MFLDKIPRKQLSAWIFSAAVGPLLSVFSGSWTTCLTVSGICSLAGVWVLHRSACPIRLPTALWVLQFVWLAVVAGMSASLCANCWQEGHTFPAVALTLLFLAAFGAKSGTEKMSRSGAVLMWLVIAVVGTLLGVGSREMRWSLLMPSGAIPSGFLAVVCLIPCLSVFLSPGNSPQKCLPLLIGGISVMLCVWMTGVLSGDVAREAGNPFYAYAQCVRLGSASLRLESLASCVLTVSWFAFLGLLLGTAGSCAERLRAGFGKIGVWLCAALAGGIVMSRLTVDAWWLALGCGIFWVFIPAASRFVSTEKICKKK